MKKSRKAKPTSVCEGCGETFDGKRQFCTPRCRKVLQCKAKGTTKFLNTVVAPLFQKMIRAENAASDQPHYVAVVNGVLIGVPRRKGQCVCVTCGKVDAWSSGIGGMHTGHFLASRRASILLEPDNVAPQCSSCNVFRDGSPSEFRLWMESVRGIEIIERLQRLKTESVSFSRDELVDMWFEFNERLKAAEQRMKQ